MVSLAIPLVRFVWGTRTTPANGEVVFRGFQRYGINKTPTNDAGFFGNGLQRTRDFGEI